MSQSSPAPAETAASSAIDVGAQQVAAVYAKALLGASEKAGQTASVLAELDAVVAALNAEPRLAHYFSAQTVRVSEKQALVKRVFKSLSSLTANFLNVLARHGRLELLAAVRSEAHAQDDTLRGRVRVHATTASAMSESEVQQLTANLRAMLAKEPVVEATVEPSLIGGLSLRIGDTVYDGSVARQLAQLREQMIHRSVHEIQSRRDRFRLTSGN